MKKATKQLLTLVILVLVLGGLVSGYYIIGAHQEREAAAAAAAEEEDDTPAFVTHRLVHQSEAEIINATFATEGGRSFTIESAEDDEGRTIWLYSGDHDILLNQSDTRNMMRDVFALTASDIILENIDDPSEYGIGRLVATGNFRDGSQETIRVGSMTPDHTRFYAMVDGDPALYIISGVSGNRLTQDLSELIDRAMPFIEHMALTRLYVRERGRESIEFGFDGTEEEMHEMVEQFQGLWLTMFTPYPGRDLTFSNFERIALEDFEGFFVGEVIEVFPSASDLTRMGFDDPLLEFAMEDILESSFHIIFGNDHDNEHIYMKFADRPHVFLAERRFIRGLLGLNPFTFIDRFVHLAPILEVDRVVLESVERSPGAGSIRYEMILNHFIDENERDVIAPTVNGIEVQDQAFRRFYQTMIGVLLDQEIGPQEDMGTPDVVITYYNVDSSIPPVVVEFFAYDPHFYATRRQEDVLEFVTSRLQIEVIFNLMEGLLAGELDR